MEKAINTARRFKKGDIVKLHGFDQQYIAIEDERENNELGDLGVKHLGGPDDGRVVVFTCCHDGSPIEKYNVVLVRAVDAVDDNAYEDGDIVGGEDECDDCDSLPNSLDITAIQQIATYASRLATMSKPDLIDLAQSIMTEDGSDAESIAFEIALDDGRDTTTRPDYVQAIMTDMLTKQYGN